MEGECGACLFGATLFVQEKQPRLIKTLKRTLLKNDVLISTVFLGMDHAFYGNRPVLFKTMIFGGPRDQEQFRYYDYDSALKHHKKIVNHLKNNLWLINDAYIIE